MSRQRHSWVLVLILLNDASPPSGALDAKVTNELPFGVCLLFRLLVILPRLNDIFCLSIADVNFRILLSLRLASPNASSTLRGGYAEVDAVHDLLPPPHLSNAVK